MNYIEIYEQYRKNNMKVCEGETQEDREDGSNKIFKHSRTSDACALVM